MGFFKKIIKQATGEVVEKFDETMDENVVEFLALAKAAAAEVADTHELVIRVSLEKKNA